ncbi:MAG: phospholipase D-like domain-containing protein [Tenuifilaceae bacterium]|jgi:phosphatidylserine/phosphatidylglycerophosphate/cardiolipin synthase-like enzyme|nr:phospholipase D-like domain-containing protein [Tenuifilaceae bacterium]
MGMNYNGAVCDLYIGKEAGKMLLSDIRSAKSSVTIVSPYLSPFLISELIDLRKRDIDIVLVTADNIEDYKDEYEKNIRKLIIQNREVDSIAVAKRERWYRLAKVLTAVAIALFVLWGVVAYIVLTPMFALALLPVTVCVVVIAILKHKISSTRIYTYWYSQLFPFRVYISQSSGRFLGTFIHSKIYLIDNEIAYMGSLNFTTSGTKYNYETRIRTVDKSAVAAISKEINWLMHQSQLPQKDIQQWGRQLYHEPIN